MPHIPGRSLFRTIITIYICSLSQAVKTTKQETVAAWNEYLALAHKLETWDQPWEELWGAGVNDRTRLLQIAGDARVLKGRAQVHRERSIELILQPVTVDELAIQNDFLRAMATQMLARSTYNQSKRFGGSLLEAVVGDADFDTAAFVAATASKIEGWFGLDSYRQKLNANLKHVNRHHALVCTEVQLASCLWQQQEESPREFTQHMLRARLLAPLFTQRVAAHDAEQTRVKAAADKLAAGVAERKAAEQAQRRTHLEIAARAWQHVASVADLQAHVDAELPTVAARRAQLAGYLEMFDVIHGASAVDALSAVYKGNSGRVGYASHNGDSLPVDVLVKNLWTVSNYLEQHPSPWQHTTFELNEEVERCAVDGSWVCARVSHVHVNDAGERKGTYSIDCGARTVPGVHVARLRRRHDGADTGAAAITLFSYLIPAKPRQSVSPLNAAASPAAQQAEGPPAAKRRRTQGRVTHVAPETAEPAPARRADRVDDTWYLDGERGVRRWVGKGSGAGWYRSAADRRRRRDAMQAQNSGM